LKQPDGTLTAAGGDTFIMFVTWDKAGTLTSETIRQFGSATLDQNSPHYADQSALFVAMKTNPSYSRRRNSAAISRPIITPESGAMGLSDFGP
jgi:hypothetical protein